MKDLALKLAKRKKEHLYRTRRVLTGPQGTEVHVDGKSYLSFCSNDYLGLANHPKIVEALKRGTDRYGVGSGAAHLVTGHCAAHHALEEELADFLARPRTLLFSTGYMANLGIADALGKHGDTIFADRLNHASLIDAARMSDAKHVRYHHNDIDDLGRRFEQQQHGNALIASDGVFSMDGDQANVAGLARLAKKQDALLWIDDAHGLGVLGRNGRGTLEEQTISEDEVPILMGTLGKAFGTFGAFVAGSEDLIETLIQAAHTYIYTTAIPPAIAEASRASLQLVREEAWRREHLQLLIQRFQQGAQQLNLPVTKSATPIQPLLTGSANEALRVSKALRENGILVTAIRPPTVPAGTSRLRLTFSADHTTEHVDFLLDQLARVVGPAPSPGITWVPGEGADPTKHKTSTI